MNPEQYARVKRIFANARELGATERRAYLDQACEGDAELRIEVEELLESDLEHSDDAFDRALSDDEEFEASLPFARPDRIGKYRILSVCGSGGMGTVFEAEQDTPLRRVALKVIQSAAPRPDLLRRFRRETEILARLQHPCIAQIFEAGEFEQDGVRRPYFAMEFVDGAPLLEFVARHALDVAARLDIFARICEAVHYAHQQGVVHRDLKPDNIFVVDSSSSGSTTSRIAGQPKVLDFGVASLTDAAAGMTMTTATGAGELLGSLPYMSPEQAAGEGSIDARSDVYSLGVVLFELLTGGLPYEVRHRAIADALQAIRYDDPKHLGSLDPGLRGDLETIVGKCIEKEKDRRYESVASLADDLRRYRALKPIAARPPSSWYQLKKFTQRNRTLVGGAATTVLAILAGGIIAAMFGVSATYHAGVAREAQARSDRLAYRANLNAASAYFDRDPAHARKFLDEISEERRGWAWQLLSSTLSRPLLEFGEVTRRRTPLPHESGARFHDVPGEDMHLLANGEEVVALSADDEFRVWRTRTGEVVRTFAAPEDVGVFAASREGNLLAAALDGGRVVTCDPRDDEPTWTTWVESNTRVDALAVSPAGDRIAIDREAEVRFGTPDAWHVVETGDRTYFVPPALEFSRDGTQLARQFDNVLLLDVATGEPIGEPMESVQINWALAIAPDHQHVAVGQMRRELRIFDPTTGAIEYQLLGHNWEISDVAYGDENRLLSTSLRGGTIRVWDLERREPIAIFDAPKTTRAEFLDADHILSLTDGRFRLWTLRDRRARELVGHDGHVFGAVFSGDGELLVTAAPWGDLIVWDALEGSPLYREAAGHRDHFTFDREGERLVSEGASAWSTGERYPYLAQPWYGAPAISLVAPARPRLYHSWHFQSKELRIRGAAVPLEMSGFHVFRTQHATRSGGGRFRAYVDGEEVVLPLPRTAPDLGPHPQLLLGPGAFYGSIAEMIVFDGPLSEADARVVDTYLMARRAGASEALRALDGVLAHFRADEQLVQLDETGHVQRWIAADDPRLALDVRGGPQAIHLVPAAAGQPAYVRFDQGYGVNNWLEMPLPQASSTESITVCWLGGYAEQEALPSEADWTAYSIETLDVWSERDARIAKTGQGGARSADGRYAAQTVPEAKVGGSVIVREVATGHCVAHFEGGDYHYFGVSFSRYPRGRPARARPARRGRDRPKKSPEPHKKLKFCIWISATPRSTRPRSIASRACGDRH